MGWQAPRAQPCLQHAPAGAVRRAARGKIGGLFNGASTPAEHTITLPASDTNVVPSPVKIVEGPDWFADAATSSIGRFSTSSSTIVEYPTPTPNASPFFITVGPDGSIWFTERIGKLGRITTTGTIAEYSLNGNCIDPAGIAVRTNRVVWATCESQGSLVRLIY